MWISKETFEIFYELNGRRYTGARIVPGSDDNGVVVLCEGRGIGPAGLADKSMGVAENEPNIIIGHNIERLIRSIMLCS